MGGPAQAQRKHLVRPGGIAHEQGHLRHRAAVWNTADGLPWDSAGPPVRPPADPPAARRQLGSVGRALAAAGPIGGFEIEPSGTRLDRVQDLLGTPIRYVSVGTRRDQIIEV